MGVVDRWMKKFLGVQAPPVPAPRDAAPTATTTTTTTAEQTLQAMSDDPGEQHLARARARLTVDASGRRYADSDDFQGELRSLDGAGRRKAADELLADALLCSPSLSLRRQLAERLLHRGERQRAKGLLTRLADDSAHAAFALTALGEIAEADGDNDEALAFYERVLAIDITLQQPKARARRLRSGSERASASQDSRATLARFLGTRAAGARYAVVDEVGRGGAATVLRARDRRIGRDVALKIFHPRGNREERKRRLVEEARIAGAFDHPHVVPVLDLDEDRDLLVMMLCDGGSLQRTVQTQGRLGPRQAVEFGAVLLRTLADIHDAGHLHLDIKPSNLLLHEGRLMVCDFGTAGMKEMGAAAGTRAYMAPEQLRASPTTGAADLFAAGLVVAECIEGRLARRGAVVLPSLPAGPRRRALERVLSMLTADDAGLRPRDGRVAAQLLLEAGALPADDSEGIQLAAQIERLARQAGDDAEQRLLAHPLVPALRP
jgi:tRNA A-37 threonylcarbamoyl transferase component Bud32